LDLVSVIIPAYNAAATLPETLASVLAQRAVDLDVVVVDDGSTDGTGEVAAQLGAPVRVIRQENAGVGAARNRGVDVARGRWVAFIDSDDLWEPDKLRLQVAAMNEPTACARCGGAP
jgi:glycosyltransferase involved in cell wall biosynthesis